VVIRGHDVNPELGLARRDPYRHSQGTLGRDCRFHGCRRRARRCTHPIIVVGMGSDELVPGNSGM
jgi:hypothetical protein